MSRRSRRSGKPGSIGLFYFQDIIFLTIGIVILVSALLSISKRISYLSTYAEARNLSVDERLNKAIAEVAFWQNAHWMFEDDFTYKSDSVRGDFTSSAIENSAGYSGLEPSSVYRATGGMWVFDNRGKGDSSAFKLKQKAVSRSISDLVSLENRYKESLELSVQMKSNRNRLIVHDSLESPLQQPWVLVLSGEALLIKRFGNAGSEHSLLMPLSEDQVNTCFSEDLGSDLCAVMMVKPSGVKHFDQLKSWLVELGVSLGFEPVDELFELDVADRQLVELL